MLMWPPEVARCSLLFHQAPERLTVWAAVPLLRRSPELFFRSTGAQSRFVLPALASSAGHRRLLGRKNTLHYWLGEPVHASREFAETGYSNNSPHASNKFMDQLIFSPAHRTVACFARQ